MTPFRTGKRPARRIPTGSGARTPQKNTARRALADHTLYVGEEGGLRGVVSLNGIRLPEYAVIPRSLPARADQVGVIHTLCIHPSCAGRGYARPADGGLL